MRLRIVFIAFGLLLSTASFAANIDSIGVESLEGKKIILHKIEAKESYYSLGRKYGVNPAAVIDFNRNKALTIGDLVKIPTQRLFEGTETVSQVMVADEIITYQVKPKETLYSIAKKFNTTIEELKTLNKLRVSSLSVGQILKIKAISTQATSVTQPATATSVIVQNNPTSVIDSTSGNDEERKLPATKYGLREVKEKGVASWIEDENLDAAKMLALHPSAPIGTIIKITNPMSQKSTFAKVVGKFTENESTRGVIIILTKTAADLIGALDKRFQVNLVYGVADEQ